MVPTTDECDRLNAVLDDAVLDEETVAGDSATDPDARTLLTLVEADNAIDVGERVPFSSFLERRGSWSKRALLAALVFSLTIVYCWIRLQDLDRLVTTDEPLWLGRSANFYQALRSGEFEHTYQMAHPGIMTMWAGAAAFHFTAPEYASLIPRQIGNVYHIDRVLREIGIDPLEMMVAAKQAKVVMQGVFFLISLLYLLRLFGWRITTVAGALIIFDPFLSGLDSALHVDGLFAITSFAAILALAYAVRAGHAVSLPWIVAGLLAACAWYTRATGILLVVVLLMILTVSAIGRIRQRGTFSVRAVVQAPAFSGLLWGGSALVASIALLPALWVDPFGTLDQMWVWARTASADGHELPTFFRGEVHAGNPGALFYPVSLLWRLTPVSMVGLALFCILIWRVIRQRRLPAGSGKVLVVTIAFGVLYVLGMTAGAKKFDRYILPVYPILDLLAAIGIVLAAGVLARAHLRFGKMIAIGGVAILLLGQGMATWSVLPYRLDFYNPLLGGPAAAVDEMQMGWGHGADQVVGFIEEDADGAPVILQSSSLEGIFSYLLPPNIRFERFGMDTPAGWYETDYFAPSLQQVQRDLSPAFHLVSGYEPVFTADVVGLDFFWVYTPKRLPLPDALQGQTGCTTDVGDAVRLMQIIDRAGSVDFYWLSIGETQRELTFAVTLHGRGTEALGQTPAATATWLPGAEGLMSKVNVPLPAEAAGFALAELVIAVVVSDAASGVQLATFRTQSECYYSEAPGG
ncbi:MAG: hypothetical protein KF883_01035 [Thermomicrobiales bacterium]|nr:hypothetical protein [Thermomicrobiales bacterium]